jgi:mannosyltransferase
MDLFRRASKIVPTNGPPQLPTADEKKGSNRNKNGLAARLAYFQRPLRLRGNSTVSVPLGVVLIFPVFVLVLILVLFIGHPNSPGRILVPAGAPPSIRYAPFVLRLDHVANITWQQNQRKVRQGVRHRLLGT